METLAQTAPQAAKQQACGAAEGTPRTLRLAYLLSQYPALSHTFFLKEILGLRARGVHIETASINLPDRALETMPQVEVAEARTTLYIKDGRWGRSLLAVLATGLAHPVAALRGLLAVIRLPGLTSRRRGVWLLYLAEALLVGRWMRSRNLKHLHVHFGGPVASVGMLASIAWELPFSLTIHGPEELLNTEAYHLREKIARAHFVFCISDFCRSQLYQLTSPDQWSKFSVVRLGVDPLVLTPATATSDGADLEVVCTGRLVAAKGHHILLRALRMVLDRGVPLHATLIGTGPERRSLEFQVKSERLEGFVTFTSGLSHAETLDKVRRADIFALASFAEGIPVALMEAMSFGVPCVSTTIAGIPELIRSGHEGLLVPPGNVEALADALEALTKDAGLRQRLGSAGRQRIISDYNLPLNQERLAQCFVQRAAMEAELV